MADVPLEHRSGQLIRDAAIAETQPWRAKHLAILRTCYGKDLFLGRVFPLVARWYAGSVGDQLAAFNENSVRRIAELLGIHIEIIRSSALGRTHAETGLNLSLARSAGASVYLSGQGGANYQDEREFERAGIEFRCSDFVPPAYQQGQLPFIARLFILDMLFSCGPTTVREALNAG